MCLQSKYLIIMLTCICINFLINSKDYYSLSVSLLKVVAVHVTDARLESLHNVQLVMSDYCKCGIHFHVYSHFGFQRHPGWTLVFLLSESFRFWTVSMVHCFKQKEIDTSRSCLCFCLHIQSEDSVLPARHS